MDLYGESPVAPQLAGRFANLLDSPHELVRLLALEGMHRLGALSSPVSPPAALAKLASNSDPEVRLLVALALGAFGESAGLRASMDAADIDVATEAAADAAADAASALRSLEGYRHVDVRCAARKARSMAEHRSIGWSRPLRESSPLHEGSPPPSTDECDVDLDNAVNAFVSVPTAERDLHGDALIRVLRERLVEAPKRVLRRLRVGEFNRAAARLCMLYLEGPNLQALGVDPDTMLGWDVSLRALLALRFLSPRDRAAEFVQSHAVRLLTGGSSREEQIDKVMKQYMGLKALAAVATDGSREAIAAFAAALGARSEAIRFGAGEALLALVPQISIGGRCVLRTFANNGPPPDAACASHEKAHGKTSMRNLLGWQRGGHNVGELALKGFELTVANLLAQFEENDTYTRLAAGVVIRRLAAGCSTQHVVGGPILTQVEAALVGQLFAGGQELKRASERVRTALAQCEYTPRTRPHRDRWWRQEPYTCLRMVNRLPVPAFDEITMGWKGDCSLENATRASRSGIVLIRGGISNELVELEAARYRSARAKKTREMASADSSNTFASSGRVYAGMLQSPEEFEPRLLQKMKEMVAAQTANGHLFTRVRA